MFGEGEELFEFDNLNLDEFSIEKFTKEDKVFMQEFKSLGMLSLNST